MGRERVGGNKGCRGREGCSLEDEDKNIEGLRMGEKLGINGMAEKKSNALILDRKDVPILFG